MMDEVFKFFAGLFSNSLWPARWYCGTWSDFHGWLYVGSSIGIALAYFSLPILIYKVLKSRTDSFKFASLLLLFILFIFFCGTTHLIDALVFWNPMYRVAALNLFITCIVSWVAVFILSRNLNSLMNLKTPDELQAVVDAKTMELQQTNAFLKSLTNDLDNFIYAASHDLKAPINNLESLLFLAKTDEVTSSQSLDYFIKMESQIGRIQEAISKLTDAAKLELSPYEGEETIDMNEIIGQFMADNRVMIHESGSKFMIDIQQKTIVFNRSALQTIFVNLLGNALKYRDSQRPLVVQVFIGKQEHKTMIRISDNGLGIDLKRHGEKLFGLFKRFHQSKPGSGMGLYFVKKIIEKNNGTIEVESTPGQGSTFIIKI